MKIVYHRRLPRFEYVAPGSLADVLELLSAKGGRAKLLAGGTDLIPQLKRREVETPQVVVDLKRIAGLNNISYDEALGLRLGCLATIAQVEGSAVVRQKFPILHQAAASIGSRQVRNRGTIAGNLCNAVPSADSAPALLTLEARLRLTSPEGTRTIGVEEFFTGPKTTVLKPTEILEEIQVPNPPPGSRGIYLKLAPRDAMDLAIVGVAVLLTVEDGTCRDIRIGLGAVAPTPMRARQAEAVIRGREVNEALIGEVAETASAECRPIDDHRASAWYRREMVKVLTARAIRKASSGGT